MLISKSLFSPSRISVIFLNISSAIKFCPVNIKQIALRYKIYSKFDYCYYCESLDLVEKVWANSMYSSAFSYSS